YNVAYFHFLEKNTNSGLNTFERRHQQAVLGNVYLQDFFFPGYTAEFVAAWNTDDSSLHYDDNGSSVRPAPLGTPITQNPGARARLRLHRGLAELCGRALQLLESRRDSLAWLRRIADDARQFDSVA